MLLPAVAVMILPALLLVLLVLMLLVLMLLVLLLLLPVGPSKHHHLPAGSSAAG